jgi:hypothetical protein
VVAGGSVSGSAANLLWQPQGIFVDDSNNLYVADKINQRVQKWALGATSGVTVAGGNGAGFASNQLNFPEGIFVDKSGNIFIADVGNHRIQKWAPGATSGVTVAGGNGAGFASTQLNYPEGVFIDATGVMYIADGGNHRIQKWLPGTTGGITVAGGIGSGNNNNQLNGPRQVFVEDDGTMYIADFGNQRIVKWMSGATSGTVFASGFAPSAIWIDGNHNVFVSDAYNGRLHEYRSNNLGSSIIFIGSSTSMAWVCMNNAGDLFVVDDDYTVKKVNVNPYTYLPTSAGNYTATVTSMNGCTATSSAYAVASYTPSISISTPNTTVCNGSNITITATAVGGLNPSYQWKLNGNFVGSNSSTYTYSPSNGDVISCALIPDYSCQGSTTTINSNTITITTQSNVPTLTINASPGTAVSSGTSVTINTSSTYGGNSPAYQWYKNNNAISGATSSSYQFTPVNNDAVYCVLTSNYSCVSTNTANSNTLSFTTTNSNAFTPGNLLVYRVGSGTSSEALSNNGNSVYLDEYTQSGTLVQSVRLTKNTTSSSSLSIVACGLQTTEGFLTLSHDAKSVVIPGYYYYVASSSSLPGTTATLVKRVVALVDGNKNVDTTSKFSDWAGASNPRSAYLYDSLYLGGGSTGIRIASKGATVPLNFLPPLVSYVR